MKTKILLFIASVLFFPAASDLVYAQEEMQYVENAVFKNPVRPPAVFEHDAHNDAAGIQECSTCHHVIEEGILIEDESSEDMSCADCHKPDPFARIHPLMKLFHKRCKGCHLEKKIGPILCGECHKRNGVE